MILSDALILPVSQLQTQPVAQPTGGPGPL